MNEKESELTIKHFRNLKGQIKIKIIERPKQNFGNKETLLFFNDEILIEKNYSKLITKKLTIRI